MDQIRCVDCLKWFDYPNEWKYLSDNDRAYLEDDFICETCHDKRDAKTYYMAEFVGWLTN